MTKETKARKELLEAIEKAIKISEKMLETINKK